MARKAAASHGNAEARAGTRVAASALGAHLGYWLRFVSNHASHAFAQKVEARGVTVAEWAVMRTLYNRDFAAPSDVARDLGMTRGAISKLVDRLEEKGFVSRVSNADDRRRQTLALTKAGLALTPALAALADQNDAEFFGDLKPSERAAIEKIMKDVVRRRGLKAIPTS